LTEVII